MTDLEDLVRTTLAHRAHDVDRVALNAALAPPVRPRRRFAVATVAAAAAAILAILAVVAPWHAAGPRPTDVATEPTTASAGPPAPPPPAGLQAVSYHGITLTVPDAWAVGQFWCEAPQFDRVAVQDLLTPTTCPTWPGDRPVSIPDSVTAVTLGELAGAPRRGRLVEVAGHPAYRVDSAQTGGPSSPLTVEVELPDAGVRVEILVQSGDASKAETVLDGITYTPVDANGCTARLSADPVPDDLPGGPVTIGAATGGVLCAYLSPSGASHDPTGTALYGSRRLTADDLALLRTLTASAVPVTDPPSAAKWSGGTLVLRLTDADGTVHTVAIRPDGTNPSVITDGRHRATPTPETSGSYSLPQLYYR